MEYHEAPDFEEKQRCISDFLEMTEGGPEGMCTWRALEMGGQGGLLAGLFAQRLAHVVSTDIVNVQVKSEGAMSARLCEKFTRNGYTFPTEKVEFLTADAQRLPFRDNWFNFCFSQNAFEHIPDPELALREAIRVTRPGGYIYLTFDPIWTADSGSHFLHVIREPWLHLMRDDEQIAEVMRSNGATDSEVAAWLRRGTNRRPVSYYREMFPRVLQELGANAVVFHEWSGCIGENHEHPNLYVAAATLNADPADLLVRGMRYLIRV